MIASCLNYKNKIINVIKLFTTLNLYNIGNCTVSSHGVHIFTMRLRVHINVH